MALCHGGGLRICYGLYRLYEGLIKKRREEKKRENSLKRLLRIKCLAENTHFQYYWQWQLNEIVAYATEMICTYLENGKVYVALAYLVAKHHSVCQLKFIFRAHSVL